MCSLAAGSSALKAARTMMDPVTSHAFGAGATTAARRPRQRPAAGRWVLCIYCQSGKFVYWPTACRLPSAVCPGCQRRDPVGGQIALPDGRPGAWPARTMLTARRRPGPAARRTDSGRWVGRPARRDRVLHRGWCPANSGRAMPGPRATDAGRGGGARPQRADHRSHRLTCLILNRRAGIKVPGRPGHVARPVTGPGSRSLGRARQLVTGIPCRRIPPRSFWAITSFPRPLR